VQATQQKEKEWSKDVVEQHSNSNTLNAMW